MLKQRLRDRLEGDTGANRERLVVYFAAVVMMLAIPYIITLIINGVALEPKQNMQDIYCGKSVKVTLNGNYEAYDVEEYLVGVLAGQIDIDSEYEAIKAQAVIARTSILKQMEGNSTIDGELLKEVYLSPDERKVLWGERRYYERETKIKSAIIDTAGVVIVSEGQLIEPLFHTVSYGKTASAMDMCDKEVSYLTSVDSLEDVSSKDYMQVINISGEEIKNLLGQETYDAAIQFSISESLESGIVKSVSYGETIYTGEDFREKLNLNSRYYTLEYVNDSYRITVLGMGHLMGLSQYGANVMAKNGSPYEEILKYYYKGVSVGK